MDEISHLIEESQPKVDKIVLLKDPARTDTYTYSIRFIEGGADEKEELSGWYRVGMSEPVRTFPVRFGKTC